MSRNLVICCDGTNNQFGPENTNVVRLVQVLGRDPARQHLYYDPGLGTLPEPGAWTELQKWLSKVAGLAVWGRDPLEGGRGILLSDGQLGARRPGVPVWIQPRGLLRAGVGRAAPLAGLMPHSNYNLVPYVLRLYDAARKEGTHRGGPEPVGPLEALRRVSLDVCPADGRRRRQPAVSRPFSRALGHGLVGGMDLGPREVPLHGAQSERRHRPPCGLARRAAVHVPAKPGAAGRQTGRTAAVVSGRPRQRRRRLPDGARAGSGSGPSNGSWRRLGMRPAPNCGSVEHRLTAVMEGRSPQPWLEPQHESLTGAWWLLEWVREPNTRAGIASCRRAP